jgi:hypothetical protein
MIELETIPAARSLRMALLLALACACSTLLILPYALQLAPALTAQLPVSMPLFATAQFIQGFVVFLFAAWLGLRLGYPFGLDAPLLRRLLGEGAVRATPANWRAAVLLGAGVGVLCILFGTLLPLPQTAVTVPPWWMGLMASFYGGIGEEVLCRLFLVSLFVWIAARLTRNATPGAAIYLGAIVLAAVLFGMGHLPQAALVFGEINVGIVLYVVGLNALCGIVFGWLFWRHGLEHAMAAHFCADLVLHVAAPLL